MRIRIAPVSAIRSRLRRFAGVSPGTTHLLAAHCVDDHAAGPRVDRCVVREA
jgi:hypothetical protein